MFAASRSFARPRTPFGVSWRPTWTCSSWAGIFCTRRSRNRHGHGPADAASGTIPAGLAGGAYIPLIRAIVARASIRTSAMSSRRSTVMAEYVSPASWPISPKARTAAIRTRYWPSCNVSVRACFAFLRASSAASLMGFSTSSLSLRAAPPAPILQQFGGHGPHARMCVANPFGDQRHGHRHVLSLQDRCGAVAAAIRTAGSLSVSSLF